MSDCFGRTRALSTLRHYFTFSHLDSDSFALIDAVFSFSVFYVRRTPDLLFFFFYNKVLPPQISVDAGYYK